MATATVVLAPNHTDDATFQAYHGAIDAALLTAGMTAVTQTGEINFGSVTRPGATDTVAGFRCYAFSDVLQSSNKVYLKVEFGTGGSTSNPCQWVTVGTGLNGSGTLTGQLGTRWKLSAGSSTDATSRTSWFSASTNRLSFAIVPDSSATYLASVFTVERSKNTSGVDTATGIITSVIYPTGSDHQNKQQFVPYAGSIPSAEGSWVVSLAAGSSSVYGTSVLASPPIPLLGGSLNPGVNALCFQVDDIGDLTTFSAKLYGVARTYLALGNARYANVGGRSNGRVAILYQ